MDEYIDYFLLWPRTHADFQSREGTGWMVYSWCLECGVASSWEPKERRNKRSILEWLIGPQLIKCDISGSFWFWLTLSFLPRLYTLFTEPLSILLFLLAASRGGLLGEKKSRSQFPNRKIIRGTLNFPIVEAKDIGCWFALFYYLCVCLLFMMMMMTLSFIVSN